MYIYQSIYHSIYLFICPPPPSPFFIFIYFIGVLQSYFATCSPTLCVESLSKIIMFVLPGGRSKGPKRRA